MSFSQSREEAIILARAETMKPGVVCDIGAGDGRTFSNSLALIERGWKGILIEPSPNAFAKLLDLHHANPNVTLLNCAIGTEDRIVKFHECSDTLYSTTREEHAKTWTERGQSYRTYWVPQITMPKVIAQLGASADILSIDAEGQSCDILFSCPLASWDVKVLVIEHDARIVELAGWMADRGYEVAGITSENALFVRPG